MKRRDALKGLGALAGAAAAPRLLTGCNGADVSDRGPRPGAGDGGPDAGPEAVGITTIVTVCMENRSYDHYLGARALAGLGGDGLAATMSNVGLGGEEVAVFNDQLYCVPDPPHGWDTSRAQLADGDSSGFLRVYQERHGADVAPHAMGYFVREQLPFTWALADSYAVCDRWFSSVLGPTWPNRMYLHSGQSGGLKVNDLPESGGIPWRSIHHQMADAGLGWAYYFNDLPFVALFKDLELDGTVRRFSQFFSDAERGTLPPLCMIDPNFGLNDDHPPHHPILGQQFLASVYRALASSPQWKNCLLVVTYDEHGGFYDHVAPPKAVDELAAEGFDQLGFRVPAVAAGPYVKQGHVSSVVRDHSSILRYASDLFGLEPLTERVEAASCLLELLDQDRLARGEWLPPAEVPAIEVDESTISESCYELTVGKQPELEALADAGFFPPELDRRRHRRDDVFEIAEQLDRLGGGRIRRGR